MISKTITGHGEIGLARAIDYTADKKKAAQSNTVKEDDDNGLARLLNYVTNEYKTKTDKIYISGHLCDPDFAKERFLLTRQKSLSKSGKNIDIKDDVTYHHIIQSFPENMDISDEEVHQCGRELAEKLGFYEAVISSHLNPEIKEDGLLHGKCKHNHIIINAYCKDPQKQFGDGSRKRKYHNDKAQIALVQRYNDEIAIAHGLPIILEPDTDKNYSWAEKEAIKMGNSWKENIRRDINEIMRVTNTWNDFVSYMKAAGYEVKENKYVTYTTPNGEHKVRDKTLGSEYKKEVLEKYWSAKKNIKENMNDVSDIAADELRQLSEEKAKNGENLYVKISKSNKLFDQKSDTFTIPLNEKIPRKETYTSYFDTQKSYRIFDENDKPIMRVSGKTLRLYYEQMNEQEQKQEKPKKAQSYTINGRYFYNPMWQTKNKRPYRIGLYDRYGRRRSIIELTLLLAVKIIRERQNQYIDKQSMPYIRTDWKLQNMIDAVEIARNRNVRSDRELTEELNITGKSCRTLKARIKKNDSVYNSYVTLEKTLSEYLSVKDYCEQMRGVPISDRPEKEQAEYTEKLEIYKRTKAVLHKYHLVNDESIADFKTRLENSVKLKEQLSDEYKSASKKYSELKKLQHQLDAAHNKEYVYDIEKNQDAQRQRETEKM